MTVDPERRAVLRAVAAAALPTALGGCNTSTADQTPTSTPRPVRGSPTQQPTGATPTDTQEPTRTPTAAPTASPTASEDAPQTGTSLTELLPAPPEAWELTETNRALFYGAGGYRGVKGVYANPSGVEYHVVIVLFEDDASVENAKRHACEVGWQVAVPYGNHLYLASTGTDRGTYTPETPALVEDRTPIPNTGDEARRLLSRSPILTAEIIENNAVSCSEGSETPA